MRESGLFHRLSTACPRSFNPAIPPWKQVTTLSSNGMPNDDSADTCLCTKLSTELAHR
jgi:hypothetical protein